MNLETCLTLPFLFLFAFSSILTLPQDLIKDDDLLALINNYLGCRKYEDGVCVQCSERFYFNKNGICCEVKPECKVFNTAEGICEECYQGWDIADGQCVQVDLLQSEERGCRKWQYNECIQCSKRWYFNEENVCTPVSDFCYTWNEKGQCSSCYRGYIVEKAECVRDPNQFLPSVDSLCAQWKNKQCTKCAHRAFFNTKSVCESVSDHCRTWDEFDGQCLSCYDGYDLAEDGKCQYSQKNTKGPDDIGCAEWDWDNSICLKCSKRWYMTNQGCFPVSDKCADNNEKGECSKCYKGYILEGGKCVWDSFNEKGPDDKGCRTWDWDNQICLVCSERWYMSVDGCLPVSDFCAQNNEFGQCTQCYKGYALKQGKCQIYVPTCQKMDENGDCLKCQFGLVRFKGGCTPLHKIPNIKQYYYAQCCGKKKEEKEGE